MAVAYSEIYAVPRSNLIPNHIANNVPNIILLRKNFIPPAKSCMKTLQARKIGQSN